MKIFDNNIWDNEEEVRLDTFIGTATTIHSHKITNGSVLSIGGKYSKVGFTVDQHFNWFQKLMWKWLLELK